MELTGLKRKQKPSPYEKPSASKGKAISLNYADCKCLGMGTVRDVIV